MADELDQKIPLIAKLLLVVLSSRAAEGEWSNAFEALLRILKEVDPGGHALVERITTPPITEEDMKLIFDAGRQAERATLEQHRGAAAPAPFFSNNGLGNVGRSSIYSFEDHDRVAGRDVFNGQRWVDIANHCAANLNRIPNRHHGFVEGMSDQLAYGTISGKQAKYLHSLFGNISEEESDQWPIHSSINSSPAYLRSRMSRAEIWCLRSMRPPVESKPGTPPRICKVRCSTRLPAIGSLDVQAVYFRGAAAINAECKASNWLSNPAKLAAFMTGVTCRAGLTQITRVLDHVLRESNQRKIGALVYVGDDCEEPREHLVPLARRLADLKIPIFLFQEGRNPESEMIFRELAQVTGGAFCRFDQNSSKQLGELLRAVAAFAVGGVLALEKQGSDAARLLLRQIR